MVSKTACGPGIGYTRGSKEPADAIDPLHDGRQSAGWLTTRAAARTARGKTRVKTRPFTPWLLSVWVVALLPGLAGCPGTFTPEGSSNVAGMIVDGLSNEAEFCASPANEEALRTRLLELINRERTSRGLGELTLNPYLNTMAEDYCCAMIEGGFFDHVDPRTGEGPGQRAIEAGYIYLAVGENLAGGQTSPEQALAEWMDSEPHRENILGAQWREVGIGIRTGGQFGVYWVLEFGNPP